QALLSRWSVLSFAGELNTRFFRSSERRQAAMMGTMQAARTLGLATLLLAAPVQANPFHFPLKPAGARLVDQDGRPFLLLADTATALFVRLGRDEALEYLRDRRIRRFTAITAALATGAPDATGAAPFPTGDVGRPGLPYFEHA